MPRTALMPASKTTAPLVGEIVSKASTVFVKAYPHPLKIDSIEAHVPAGQTIAQIIGNPELPAYIWIGDCLIPPELWARVRPKAGSRMVVRVVPEKDALRMAALIGLAVFAPWAAGLAGLGALGTAALAAGITLVGTLAINALLPPQQPSTGGSSGSVAQRPALTGSQNAVTPWNIIPRLYGTHKYFPPIPMTALPYTELVGADQYLRMMVVLGYGPLQIGGVKAGDGGLITHATTLTGDPIRIGDTPITEFTNVEFQIGDPADITLYNRVIVEQQPNVPFDQVDNSSSTQENVWLTDGVSNVRTTDEDTVEISIDITYPGGLFCVSAGGSDDHVYVDWKIETSPTGAGTWSTVINPWAHGTKSRETQRFGYRWTVAKGQYDVRLTRVRTFLNDAEGFVTNAVWSALRSHKEAALKPFNVPDVVVMALRIKASEQLSGTVNQLSVLASSYLDVWNGSAWVSQATNNPAWAYVDALTGTATRRPLDKAKIDTAAMLDWATWCDTNSISYNAVIDSQVTVFDVAREIASCGRAAWAVNDDASISVIRDVAVSTPKMLITPRNSWGFQAEQVFHDMPHALRVQFTDPDTWEATERIVYDDGYTSANATKFDTLPTRGVTNAAQAWKEGRYHLAQMRLRPERFTWSQEIQHLVYRRGDLVAISHDVLVVGLRWGRVTSVTGSPVTTFTSDERLFMEVGKNYGVRVQKLDGTIATVGIALETPYTTTPVLNTATADIEAGCLFIFGEVGAENIDVKVVEVSPQGDFTAQVVAVPSAPAILDADTGTIPDYDPAITTPIDESKLPPAAPSITGLRSDESVLVRDSDGAFMVRLVVDFASPAETPGSDTYVQARYRVSNVGAAGPVDLDPGVVGESWRLTAQIHSEQGYLSIYDVIEGALYEVQVRAYRGSLWSSWSAAQTHTIIGKSTPPPDVVQVVREGSLIRWLYPVVPPDFDGFRVRWNPGTTVNWSAGINLREGLHTTAEADISGLLSIAGSQVVMVKAVDVAGNESTNPASLLLNMGDPLVANVADTLTYDPAFIGDITGGTVSGGDLVADGDGGLYLPNASALYLPTGGDLYLPTSYGEMIYIPAGVISGGGGAFGSVSFGALQWGGLDETTYGASYAVPAGVTLTDTLILEHTITGVWSIEYRFTTADSWRPYTGVISPFGYSAVYFRVTVAGGTTQGVIAALSATLDAPDIVERFDDLALASGGTRLPITRTYRAIKVVNITLQAVGTATTVKILDKDASLGPLIRAYDSGGTGVTATVDVIIQGY